MTCHSVRAWLHRCAESLTEAERLVLEDHLEGCTDCRGDRARLQLAREIGTALPEHSIGPRGHQRAIARALMQGAPVVAASRRRVSWRVVAALGGALACAAVAVSLWLGSGDSVATLSPNTHASPEPPAGDAERVTQNVASPNDSVESEMVVIGGTLESDAVFPVDTAVPADVRLRATTEVKLRAFASIVVVGASSEIRRPAMERAILLDRGQLDVDGPASRVVTEAFSVESTGAVTITPRRVAVRGGEARVVGSDGKLLASLAAGQTWELADSRAAKPSAASLLEQAHAAFQRGDHAIAERQADAALDATPTRIQAAEARTILAECAQITGRLDDALQRYEAIATRFSDLPAGETALFAAARLEANRNRAPAARELMQRYLERYPDGRFAEDARRQLRAPR